MLKESFSGLFLWYNIIMNLNLDLSQVNVTEAVVMLVVGLLLAFAGYKIKKIGFFLAWFFVGYTAMGYIMPTINGALPDVANNQMWQGVLPIAGGLLVGLLGFTIEKLCVGGLVFALTLVMTAKFFGSEMQTMLIGGVVGVVAAGAAVMLMKPAIIIATAALGGFLVSNGILYFATGLDPATWLLPIIGIVGVFGGVVQFMTGRGD